MDFLGGLPWGGIANYGGLGIAFAVVLYVARMIFTGDLIPRSTHQDTLKERDDWKGAHAISEEVRRLQAEQLADLRDAMGTVERFIQALPQPRQQPRGGR